MRVKCNVFILAKLAKPWKDSNGNLQTFYSANITQNNGEIIDTLRLNQEQFTLIEANQHYTVTADFGTGKNGGYLRVIDIAPAK